MSEGDTKTFAASFAEAIGKAPATALFTISTLAFTGIRAKKANAKIIEYLCISIKWIKIDYHGGSYYRHGSMKFIVT